MVWLQQCIFGHVGRDTRTELALFDNAGAPGFTGVDFVFTAPGHQVASLVFAGYSSADLACGRLHISYGTTADLPGLPGSQFATVTP